MAKKYSDNLSINSPAISMQPIESGLAYDPLDLYKSIPDNLDKIIDEIDELRLNASKYAYLIGLRLIEIRDKYLHELPFNNIVDYADKELKISEGSVRNYIFLAEAVKLKKYFTENQVLDYSSKLYPLKKIEKLTEPEKKIAELLEWIEQENRSYKEIVNRVKDLFIAEKGIKEPDPIRMSDKSLTINFELLKNSLDDDKIKQFKEDLEKLIEKYNTE